MATHQDVNPAAKESELTYEPARVVRDEHAEGPLTRLIEQQTAKLPSDVFLFSALGAMAGSLVLEVAGHPRLSRFVGMWPPTLLVMGLYNKMVKLIGPK